MMRTCLSATVILLLAGCTAAPDRPRWPVVGNAAAGRIAIARLGCGSCHLVPGVENADGMVGPPLSGFARRTIVAGVLPNTPRNLIHWIKEPQTVVPGNAMPNVGTTDAQARDIAAYLYTLD